MQHVRQRPDTHRAGQQAGVAVGLPEPANLDELRAIDSEAVNMVLAQRKSDQGGSRPTRDDNAIRRAGHDAVEGRRNAYLARDVISCHSAATWLSRHLYFRDLAGISTFETWIA